MYYLYPTSSFSASFGSVELCELTQEITSSNLITSAELQYINRIGNDLYIYFNTPLDAGDESDLTFLIENHQATSSYCIDQESFLTDGSRPLSGNLNAGGYDIININQVDGVDISSHSLRHLSGGADQIDGDKIDIDFEPLTYTPSTGSGVYADSEDNLTSHLIGIDEKLLSISSSIPTVLVWGQNFSQSISTGSFSTTSNNFQEAFTLDVSASYSGLYRIGWNYFWRYGSVNNDFVARIVLDDIDLVSFHREEPSDSGADQVRQEAGYKYVNLTSGLHFFDLDIRASQNGVIAQAISSSFEFWRAS